MITPSIIRLLIRSRPFYVLCFVMTVSVNTFNRMVASGSVPDFLEELVKRIKSKFNATPTIQSIIRIIGIITSTLSVAITFIFRRRSHAVRSLTGSRFFNLKTSATARVLVNQGIRTDGFNCPTITLCPPPRYSVNFPFIAYDNKACKSLPRQILKARIGWNRMKRNVIFSVGHIVSCLGNLIRLGEVLFAPVRAVSISVAHPCAKS